MVIAQRKLANHTIRQRMGRGKLKQVLDALSGKVHRVYPLASGRDSDHDSSIKDVEMSVWKEAQSNPSREPPVPFNVEPLIPSATIPAVKEIECFMFDYSKATRTSRNQQEKFNEFFGL